MMSGVTGMKLARFDLYRYGLPFSRPLTLGGITRFQREGILLRLSGEDGSEGWGETAPLPGFSVESLVDATAQLRRLAASIVGREVKQDWVDPYGEFGRGLDRVAPSVRFGLELAVWNLYGDSSGRSLAAVMAPLPRSVVPVNGLLAGSPAKVLEEARSMRDAGYSCIKLKVGTRTVAEDAALVRTLGEEIGEGISLRLDANRAWGYEEAAEFVGGTAGVSFEYVEEPLADPPRLPWLVRALRLGVTPVISSAYEGGVGTAALVALAAGIGDRPVAAGVDPYSMLAEDVLETPLNLPAPDVDVWETADASRTIEFRRLECL